jgi:preprotein translocase subunit SecA
MFGSIARKMFGTVNERKVKTLLPTVDAINALEPELEKLTDPQIQAKTEEFRKKLKEGASLDDILVEAFAVVREASKRTLGMRHFDVQLIGGMVLHEGMIAEMKTGEGKTLVSTLAAYLNAIEGKGVHVITVNDYLAKRDAEWMGQIFTFLGLTVGCITHDVEDEDRKEAYAKDITYGTNNEYGFDYLRDNMKFEREEMVQRPFNFAIVDEVDSILVDEARTPLIISGPTEDNSELYTQANQLIPKLKEEDYEVDEKAKTVVLTEEGTQKIEDLLLKNGLMNEGESLYDINNISLVHHVDQALRAHKLFEKDTDYIVKDRKVIIIDEFTGRMMEGRRFSEGLHQALEAKEKAIIQNENQTLASITFQNYFRLYPKLSGMTGTAMTEASEFEQIYNLSVVDIPTHREVSREDDDDLIYRTLGEKHGAIVDAIKEAHKKHQPVLVGTISIEKSEHLGSLLKKEKIPHNVLNARYHEKEATIIAQAGRKGAVTIATNMAGRGTDIMLGGNPDMLFEEKSAKITDEKKRIALKEKIFADVKKEKEAVIKAGGLYVIGTERHESRRIDNQLRGRSGRQGDPGHSTFFISLEDDLMRIFGSERIESLLKRIGLEEGEAIHHPWMTRALEKAQSKVEERNFEIRKTLLKFDDVMNDQRKVIFEQRKELMDAEDVSETLKDMRIEMVDDFVSTYIPEKAYAEQWETETLETEVFRVFGIQLPIQDWAKEDGIADREIYDRTLAEVDKIFSAKEAKYGAKIIRDIERRVLLYTLDQMWKDHLLSLDQLKQGINLRAYGQKDPLNEYKKEAFVLFEQMLRSLRETALARLAHMEIHTDPQDGMEPLGRRPQVMLESRIDPAMAKMDDQEEQPEGPNPVPVTNKPKGPFDVNDPSTWGKVGRNQECPCGSGKKYKYCHGKDI